MSVKLIIDSASDISEHEAKTLGITMLALVKDCCANMHLGWYKMAKMPVKLQQS